MMVTQLIGVKIQDTQKANQFNFTYVVFKEQIVPKTVKQHSISMRLGKILM